MKPPVVSTADVEWIDTYLEALVCGHRLTRGDILRLEDIHDRRSDGRLTAAAKERIAGALTVQLQERDARALAAWETRTGRRASWRNCNG